MTDRSFLGEFELMILLAVVHLDGQAYGVPISRELERHRGRDVSVGSVYAALERLEIKGLVTSTIGDPTPERGGKAKRYFRVTRGRPTPNPCNSPRPHQFVAGTSRSERNTHMRQTEPLYAAVWLLNTVNERDHRMNRMLISFAGYCLLSGSMVCAQQSGLQETGAPVDSSHHTVKFVTVENDVKLEVLDWGGAGRPLVLLAGMMFDAHVYDTFAQKLTQNFHVYGITRRGFGASSAPKPDCGNYSADRLGDDVLAVLDNLKINRPILVGHSLAGEELSSIGSRFPAKVAGLIYLDAANSYAFYNDSATQGDPIVDSAALRAELEQLIAPLPPKEMKARVTHVLQVSMPRMQRDLQETLKETESAPDSAPPPPDLPMFRAMAAAMRQVEIFSVVKAPILAIYAAPHDMHQASGGDSAKQATLESSDLAKVKDQARAVEAANPSAHVVLLPHADHFIFRSNEADVLREMKAFIATLQ